MWLDSMPNFASSMAFEMHQLVRACAASLVREACCLDKSLIYVAALAAPRHATSSSVSELGEVGLELINEVSSRTDGRHNNGVLRFPIAEGDPDGTDILNHQICRV